MDLTTATSESEGFELYIRLNLIRVSQWLYGPQFHKASKARETFRIFHECSTADDHELEE